MEPCLPLAPHPRRDTILFAIGEHDNGWADEDASPSVDPATGAIVDFVSASLDVRHRVWPRAIARLRSNPWAAALVAQHAITVYDRFRSDPDWTTFLDEMRRLRDALLQGGELSMEALLEDYRYVRLADLISLTFCTGWAGEHTFGGWTVALAGSRVIVTPGVFGADVPIEIDAQVLPVRAFWSNADLREALRAGRTVSLKGIVSGSR